MRIESKINEKFFRESQKINLNFLFGRKLKSVKQNLFLLIFIFAISYQLVSDEISFGYILLGFGFMFLVNIIWFYYSYYKIKNNHLKKIENEISYYKINPDEIIINEFREKEFFYKDYKMEFTLIWDKFESFEIKNNYLVLKSFGGNYLNFFLNKEEIETKDFDKIITIVRKKIKK